MKVQRSNQKAIKNNNNTKQGMFIAFTEKKTLFIIYRSHSDKSGNSCPSHLAFQPFHAVYP